MESSVSVCLFFPSTCCSMAETWLAVEFWLHKYSQLHKQAQIVPKCLLLCLLANFFCWVGLDHSQLSYPVSDRDVAHSAGIVSQRRRIKRLKMTSILNNSPLSLKGNYWLFFGKCIAIHLCYWTFLISEFRKRHGIIFSSYWLLRHPRLKPQCLFGMFEQLRLKNVF